MPRVQTIGSVDIYVDEKEIPDTRPAQICILISGTIMFIAMFTYISGVYLGLTPFLAVLSISCLSFIIPTMFSKRDGYDVWYPSNHIYIPKESPSKDIVAIKKAISELMIKATQTNDIYQKLK